MSGRNKGKAKISISKPELPPFLQRIKEQIVANEDADRREQSQRKRKERPGRPGDPDDDPTIVKLGDEDLTEEEYKKIKKEMATQYKLDSDKIDVKREELDVDVLIQIRQKDKDLKATTGGNDEVGGKPNSSIKLESNCCTTSTSKSMRKAATTNTKKLSYGSSSEDED